MKLHHPVGYAIADHAAKIFKTDEFKRAAKNAGLRAEDFQNHVVAELKRLVAAQRAEELAAYERALELQAVAAAAEKLKAEQAA